MHFKVAVEDGKDEFWSWADGFTEARLRLDIGLRDASLLDQVFRNVIVVPELRTVVNSRCWDFVDAGGRNICSYLTPVFSDEEEGKDFFHLRSPLTLSFRRNEEIYGGCFGAGDTLSLKLVCHLENASEEFCFVRDDDGRWVSNGCGGAC